ncbi:hypothetical protein [Natrinema gelatinilyticum]|uniref:hypothetical protein n=1 Tax=Natrinema gelatinilyticum TaxID=2961571 RepID=UPI0020C2192E|nr:hypothetical protein [Natrinema gelatinilyticum]
MQSTILVVDDGRELATIYAMWVGEDEEVATAYDGRRTIPMATIVPASARPTQRHGHRSDLSLER